jgi:hypothetical protein
MDERVRESQIDRAWLRHAPEQGRIPREVWRKLRTFKRTIAPIAARLQAASAERDRIKGLLYDWACKGETGRARALAKLRRHFDLATITFPRQGIMWSWLAPPSCMLSVHRALADAGLDPVLTMPDNLACVLGGFGHALWRIAFFDPALSAPTVMAWLRHRPGHLRDAALLLLVETPERQPGAHWIAVKGDEVGDCLVSCSKWQPGPGDIAGWFLGEAHVVAPHVPDPAWVQMRKELDSDLSVYAPGAAGGELSSPRVDALFSIYARGGHTLDFSLLCWCYPFLNRG